MFRKHWPLLLAFMLAAAVRCYRLADQSLWWDEYLQVGSLRVPDLKTYLTTWVFWSADNVPLYQIVLWNFHSFVSSNVLGMRLLSVAFALAALPLLYGFTLRYFGSKAALWSGVFLALSAHHTWYAQAIRPYALLELMVMLSWVSLFEALRTGRRRWWFAHMAANLAALATHPFVVFLFALEGVLLLLARWRNFKLLFFWTGVHLAAGAVLLYWLASHVAYLPERDYDHYYLPELAKVLFDFLGDDAVMRTNEFGFPITNAPVTLFMSADTYLRGAALFDAGLVLLSFAAAAGCGVLAFRAWRREGNTPFTQACAWLLGVFLGPSAMLLLLTLLVRPMFETRYSTYSSFALYAMLGLLISRIPWRAGRVSMGLVCAIVFSYHLLALMSGTTRADWSAVAAVLKQERVSEEALFAHYGGQWNDEVLAYAAGVSLSEVGVGYSARGLCRKVHARLAAHPDASVWMAVSDMDTPATRLGSLSAYFTSPGYDCEMMVLPGGGPIALYRVKRLAPDAAANLPPLPAKQIAPLVYAADPTLDPAVTEEELGDIFDTPVPPSKLHYFVLAMFLYEEGHTDLGRAAAEAALGLDPKYPAGLFARAVGLALAGDTDAAWAAYEAVRAEDEVWMPLFEPFMRAALRDKNREAASAALAPLEYSGFPYRAMRQLYAEIFSDT